MMRSELRDKVAELLMEAIAHRDKSALVYWLRAYCQVAGRQDPPIVSFSQWASVVQHHRKELRFCGGVEEEWGRMLVSGSGLFRAADEDRVAIAPEYRKELPAICERAQAYWQFLKALHRRQVPPGLPGVLQQAALLWHHRLFFEFHEILEGVWMHWSGPERSFLQGFIQLGVAFYHMQRDNYSGAMSMFRYGRAKVEPHSPRYCGVELTKFLDRIEKCRETLKRLGPGRCLDFDWRLVPPLEVEG
jgi:hypothetical protein